MLKLMSKKRGMADALIYLLVLILLVLIIVLFFFIFRWRHEVIQNRLAESIKLNDMNLALINYARTPVKVSMQGIEQEMTVSDLVTYSFVNGQIFAINTNTQPTGDELKDTLISETKRIMDSYFNTVSWEITVNNYDIDQLKTYAKELASKEYYMAEEYKYNYGYLLLPKPIKFKIIAGEKETFLLLTLKEMDYSDQETEQQTPEQIEQSEQNICALCPGNENNNCYALDCQLYGDCCELEGQGGYGKCKPKSRGTMCSLGGTELGGISAASYCDGYGTCLAQEK